MNIISNVHGSEMMPHKRAQLTADGNVYVCDYEEGF